jgi:mono/diheme cytochrome c family protein
MKRLFASTVAIFAFAMVGLAILPSSHADSSSAGVTFTKDVAPIFFKNCAECHRPGESAPMSLLSYKEARPWAKSIREKVVSREMPPWHADPHVGEFSNDRRLSPREVDTISAWVDGGAPEGDLKDLPPPPQCTDGWGIGKPDLVLQMTEEYTLDATGPDEYQLFDIPTKFSEDMYISMAEARPGNRKVVHHIIAFILPPGAPTLAQMKRENKDKAIESALKDTPFYREGSLIRTRAETPVYDNASEIPDKLRGFNGVDDFLTAYAPGHNPDIWTPGAKKIGAGSTIRLQIHYSKVAGTAQKDRSVVGLVFAKQPPDRLIKSQIASNTFFKIPAGADNHKVTAVLPVVREIRLYTLMPHMHLRGKAMDFTLFYPDGRSEALLKVPGYSFSWQTSYRLKEPRVIPRGSRIEVTGYFDNSARNRFNPDPARDVRYGEPTYDEMMMGLIEYSVVWPVYANVDKRLYDDYAGRYQGNNNRFASVLREGDRLQNVTVSGRKLELVPIGKDKFYLYDTEIEITFVRNEKGEVVERQLDVNGQTVTQKKESAQKSAT